MHALKPVQTKYFNSGPTEQFWLWTMSDLVTKNYLRLGVTDANDFIVNMELF